MAGNESISAKVDEETKITLRVAAARQNKTMSTYLREIIEREVARIEAAEAESADGAA